MVNLILSSLFNLRTYHDGSRTLFVVIDRASGVDPDEYVRCARPWRTLRALGVLSVDMPSISAAIDAAAASAADVVAVVSDRPAFSDAATALCRTKQLTCVDASVPPQGSRDQALFQEVMHHDTELGGFSEWKGSDSRFGSSVLKTLSMAHCHRVFPMAVAGYLPQLRRPGRPIAALDVGCGALSKLRWGALNADLEITGVDPLLDMYAIVRERHGLSPLPHVRCAREVCVGAEDLAAHVAPSSFDFVYSCNALDHVNDPVAAAAAMVTALRPDGILMVQVYTREGTRENWWQLHQFDLFVDDDDQFLCQSRDGTVRPMFPAELGVRIVKFVRRDDELTSLIAQRGPAAPL